MAELLVRLSLHLLNCKVQLDLELNTMFSNSGVQFQEIYQLLAQNKTQPNELTQYKGKALVL